MHAAYTVGLPCVHAHGVGTHESGSSWRSVKEGGAVEECFVYSVLLIAPCIHGSHVVTCA